VPDELETIRELLSDIEAPPGPTAGAKRLRWVELSLVLLVSFGGAFLSSLHLWIYGRSLLHYFDHSSWSWTIRILHEATCLLLLGYVLSRRGMRFRDLGLRWSLRDLLSGLILAVVASLTYLFISYFFYFFHRALYSSPPGGLTAREILEKGSRTERCCSGFVSPLLRAGGNHTLSFLSIPHLFDLLRENTESNSNCFGAWNL